jgi:hypothetical protein
MIGLRCPDFQGQYTIGPFSDRSSEIDLVSRFSSAERDDFAFEFGHAQYVDPDEIAIRSHDGFRAVMRLLAAGHSVVARTAAAASSDVRVQRVRSRT